jgi:hypothetical protein
MGELANKMLVRHASLGLGKVVALEPTAVHVFFPEGGGRFAAKLRLPDARVLLRIDGIGRDAWLEGLSDFALDQETNRYALATTWLTHEQAVAQFLALFPRGFADPGYLAAADGSKGRASLWRDAHDTWLATLDGAEGERLLAAGDVREIVRRVLRVERHVSALEPATERLVMKEALADAEATSVFFRALLEVVAAPAPGRARFERLFAAALRLKVPPQSRWGIVTLLPFVARPDRHVLLRPRATCDAAARLGCDLRFGASPNWTTYAALRSFSVQLLQRLEPLGARDFVDVESFLHTIAARRSKVVTGSSR